MPTGGWHRTAPTIAVMTRSHRITYAGALLIALVGLIHAFEVSDGFEDQAYVGVLFIANALGSLVVACALIARPRRRAVWALGAAVAAGAFVGFILSRTTGLPSYHETDWDGIGLGSLAVEAGYLAVAARVLTYERPVRVVLARPVL